MKQTRAASAMALTLLLSTVLPARADAVAVADSRQQIERLVEQFRVAIIDKDTKRFMKLFLREDITWVATIDDASLNAIVARRTDQSLPRPKKVFGAIPREFMKHRQGRRPT